MSKKIQPIPEHYIKDLAWAMEAGKTDPVMWIDTFLNGKLYKAQRELVELVRDNNRVAISGAHGTGKGAATGYIATWWTVCMGGFVVVMRNPFNMLIKTWWADWRDKMANAVFPVSNDLADSWHISPTKGIVCVNTDDPKNIPGFHAPKILFIIDEAAGIHYEIFDAIQGALCSDDAKLILLGQPLNTDCYFHDCFSNPFFKTMKIAAKDSPNVTGEMHIPGMVTGDWIEEMGATWGVDSAQYRVRVLGEFPLAGATNRLITEASLQESMFGEPKLPAACLADRNIFVSSGVDVAGPGVDSTLHAIIKNNVLVDLAEYGGLPYATEIALWIAERNVEHGVTSTSIDATGIGYYVAMELEKLALLDPAVGVVNKKTMNRVSSNPDRYKNVRTELIIKGSEAMNGGYIKLPPESTPKEVYDDMRAIWYQLTTNGGIEAEPKDKTRRRLKRSPDYSDTVFLAIDAASTIQPRSTQEYVDDLYKIGLKRFGSSSLASSGRF